MELESKLEAIIQLYDSEMLSKQKIFDEFEKEEKDQKAELDKLEKTVAKWEKRYARFMEEKSMKEIEAALKLRKKKKVYLAHFLKLTN